MLKAVLTADIKRSTMLDSFELENIQKTVKEQVLELEQQGSVSKISFFRGDSFQVLVNHPEEALRVALLLKTSINMRKVDHDQKSRRAKPLYDVTISIGLGKVEQDIDINRQNERPFILSGRGLDYLKKQNHTLGVFTGHEENDITYATIFELYDWIMKQWSVTSVEVVYYKLKGLKEREIAPLLNISQSAVNQRSQAACWNGLEQIIAHFKTIGAGKYG